MATRSSLATGIGRVLIAVYGILALAATGRSVVQIIEKFSFAPFAYTLSAVAAVVYIVAMIALIVPGRFWYRVACVTIVFEMTGVLVIGTPVALRPRSCSPTDTIWSYYGLGYAFAPLVLPIAGLWWLRKHHRTAVSAPAAQSEPAAAAGESTGEQRAVLRGHRRRRAGVRPERGHHRQVRRRARRAPRRHRAPRAGRRASTGSCRPWSRSTGTRSTSSTRGTVPPALTSTAQRRELLEAVGVDATLLLRFDEELQS